MIGAVVFVIAFVLFLLISFVISLPPGLWIVEEYIPDIMQTDYESLAIGIINGMITTHISIIILVSIKKVGNGWLRRVSKVSVLPAARWIVHLPMHPFPRSCPGWIRNIREKRGRTLKKSGPFTNRLTIFCWVTGSAVLKMWAAQ